MAAKIKKSGRKKYKAVYVYIGDSQLPVVGRILKKKSKNEFVVQVRGTMPGSEWSNPVRALKDGDGRIYTLESGADPRLAEKLYPKDWFCRFCKNSNKAKNEECTKCKTPRFI